MLYVDNVRPGEDPDNPSGEPLSDQLPISPRAQDLKPKPTNRTANPASNLELISITAVGCLAVSILATVLLPVGICYAIKNRIRGENNSERPYQMDPFEVADYEAAQQAINGRVQYPVPRDLDKT